METLRTPAPERTSRSAQQPNQLRRALSSSKIADQDQPAKSASRTHRGVRRASTLAAEGFLNGVSSAGGSGHGRRPSAADGEAAGLEGYGSTSTLSRLRNSTESSHRPHVNTSTGGSRSSRQQGTSAAGATAPGRRRLSLLPPESLQEGETAPSRSGSSNTPPTSTSSQQGASAGRRRPSQVLLEGYLATAAAVIGRTSSSSSSSSLHTSTSFLAGPRRPSLVVVENYSGEGVLVGNGNGSASSSNTPRTSRATSPGPAVRRNPSLVVVESYQGGTAAPAASSGSPSTPRGSAHAAGAGRCRPDILLADDVATSLQWVEVPSTPRGSQRGPKAPPADNPLPFKHQLSSSSSKQGASQGSEDSSGGSAGGGALAAPHTPSGIPANWGPNTSAPDSPAAGARQATRQLSKGSHGVPGVGLAGVGAGAAGSGGAAGWTLVVLRLLQVAACVPCFVNGSLALIHALATRRAATAAARSHQQLLRGLMSMSFAISISTLLLSIGSLIVHRRTYLVGRSSGVQGHLAVHHTCDLLKDAAMCALWAGCLVTHAVYSGLVAVRPLALSVDTAQIVLHIASALAVLWLRYTVNRQQQYSGGRQYSGGEGAYRLPRYKLGAALPGT